MTAYRTSIEVKDLSLVRAIADCGGVSKAGQRLHLSQSAVSHHLARLETRLGCKLFERVGRRLVLNRQGQRLAELSEEISQRIIEVERLVRQTGKKKTIRMSTECYTAYHWLGDVLEAFAEVHPQVEVAIAVEATQDPLDALERGTIDLALCHAAPPKRWASRMLFEDEFVLIASPDHPLAKRSVVTPKALSEQVLIVYERPAKTLKRVGKELFGAHLRFAKVERVPLTEAIIALVRSGRGVSIISRWIAMPYVAQGQVKIIRMSGVKLQRKWRAVYDRKASLRPELDALSALLRNLKG